MVKIRLGGMAPGLPWLRLCAIVQTFCYQCAQICCNLCQNVSTNHLAPQYLKQLRELYLIKCGCENNAVTFLNSTDEVPKRKRGRPRKDQAICSKPSMSRGRRPVFGPPKLEKSYQQTLLNNEASSLLPVADPLQENGSSVATTVSENTSIFGYV